MNTAVFRRDTKDGPNAARRSAGVWLEVLFVPAVIAVLVIYLALDNAVFATSANLSNLLNQMVLLMIVSVGSTFVILSRELDLSIGAGVAITSVLVADVMVRTGSVLAGVLTGIAMGLCLGLVNGLLVTRLEVPAFIATLGTAVILRGIALSLTDGGVITGLPAGFVAFAKASFLGLSSIAWLMVVTLVALHLLQTQTSFGYRVLAVGGNAQAARLAGIPVLRIKMLCFLIGGLTIALGGLALTARVQSGQPNGAMSLELYAVAAIVIGGTSLFGGRGSVLRTVSGVLLIVILQNGLDLYGVSYDLQQVVVGAVFIGAASVDFVRRQLDRRRQRAQRVAESVAPPDPDRAASPAVAARTGGTGEG